MKISSPKSYKSRHTHNTHRGVKENHGRKKKANGQKDKYFPELKGRDLQIERDHTMATQ